MTHQANVIAGGTIVIPADLRRKLGIDDGDTSVIGRSGDGAVRFVTVEQAVRNSQAKARRIFGAVCAVDTFLQKRRAYWDGE